MEKDLVYLVWTDRKTGNKYKVAELYKQGNTFYFRPPGKFEQFLTVSDMLSKCLLKVNDEVKEINFLEMPAFVLKLANDIFTTLAIPGPNGPITGIGNIIGLFE